MYQNLYNTIFGVSYHLKYNKKLTFCDTSCGTGNIIYRYLEDRICYIETIEEFLDLVGQTYGYDIIPENIEECKDKIRKFLSIFIDDDTMYGFHLQQLNKILDKNIICADYLIVSPAISSGFDLIIQNPPHTKGAYLNFLNKAFDDLSEDGELVSIQPAVWLINLHSRGRNYIYRDLKRKFSHLTTKVIIENYNKEFKSSDDLFSIISVYKRNVEKFFSVEVCGEEFACESLNDINLIDSTIGAKAIIHDIANKCLAYVDMLKNHVYENETKEELDNFDYNVRNCKIFTFIDLLFNNKSSQYIPWIADKKYKEEEIYKLLDLNEQEIEIINKGVSKFNKLKLNREIE